MPRILLKFLRRAPSQPGLTPAMLAIPDGAADGSSEEQASGVHPIGKCPDNRLPQSVPETNETKLGTLEQQIHSAPLPIAHAMPDPAKCRHVWATFVLPAEGKGRVFQCQLCRAIGFRMNRFGGPGNGPGAASNSIRLYTCSRGKCQGVAVRRMTGRGPRGAYIWACAEHGTLIEGNRPAP